MAKRKKKEEQLPDQEPDQRDEVTAVAAGSAGMRYRYVGPEAKRLVVPALAVRVVIAELSDDDIYRLLERYPTLAKYWHEE